jgi:hypothetical protein
MKEKIIAMLDALQLPYNDGCINYIINSYYEECDEVGNIALTFAMLKDYWIEYVKYLMN